MPASLRHLTIWLLIGTAIFVALKWAEHRREATAVVALGAGIDLGRGVDGHYHWSGRIEGRPVQFLVDTGATRSALPAALAQKLGLPRGDEVSVHTAGGEVTGWVTQADLALDGGPRVRRMRFVVMPQLGTPLLGMDVLSKMRVEQHQGRMRIRPPSASGAG